MCVYGYETITAAMVVPHLRTNDAFNTIRSCLPAKRRTLLQPHQWRFQIKRDGMSV